MLSFRPIASAPLVTGPASDLRTGTASQTLGAFTQVSTGKLIIQGTAAQTIGAFTQSTAGKLIIQGQAAQTLGSFTQSATGKLIISGIAAQTVGNFTQSAAGKLIIQGTAAQTLGSFNQTVLSVGILAPQVGRITGGTFSRGKWRRLKEAEEAERKARELAAKRKRVERREAMEKAAKEARAAIEAARLAEDQNFALDQYLGMMTQSLEAMNAAKTLAETTQMADAARAYALQAQKAVADNDDDEAIAMLLVA